MIHAHVQKTCVIWEASKRLAITLHTARLQPTTESSATIPGGKLTFCMTVALPAPNASDPYAELLQLTWNKGKENL
jgi:hypothetical protein